MTLRTLLLSSIASIATAAFAAPASAPAVHECVAGAPTAASYTWNFQGEANTIFRHIQSDAQQALDHAVKLQSYEDSEHLDWQAHVGELDPLKHEVNDMGAKLCRLEVIRRVTAPWQQAEIDRIAATLRLMADNTESAITFGNEHQRTLWVPAYQTYTDNLYNEALSLTHSVDHAVSYAKAAKEYRQMRKEMGMPSAS